MALRPVLRLRFGKGVTRLPVAAAAAFPAPQTRCDKKAPRTFTAGQFIATVNS